MLRANQLVPDRAMVCLIDVQEKLLPLVRDHSRVTASIHKLLEVAPLFGLPVLVTEQYPKGLGTTIKPLLDRLETCQTQIMEKPTFSAWAHEPIREAIVRIDRPQIVLVGIETHVCIQTTALDLVSRDYDVFVCGDAVSSRGYQDYKFALSRMRQEGAWVTTVESVLFELCQTCESPKFKEMIEVIKRYPPEASSR